MLFYFRCGTITSRCLEWAVFSTKKSTFVYHRKKQHGFRTTWVWVNNYRIVIFGWTIALNPWDNLEESSEESKAQSLKSVEIPVPGKAIEKWIQYWLIFAFSWRVKGIMGLGVSKIWVDSNRMLDELILPKNKTLTIVLAVTENVERSMLLKW